MMNIEEGNEIIKEVIYQNIASNIKVMKIFDEFGYYKYIIYAEVNEQTNTFDNICLGFKCEDFNQIYEYSGKETFATEFKNYDYYLDVNSTGIMWNVVFKINIKHFQRVFEKIPKDISAVEREKIIKENELLKKDLEQYATVTSQLFSRLRVIFYSDVMKKMFVDLNEKKSPPTFILKLNENNIMYLLPAVDKIILIYGIHFQQKTDVSLAKVFLQELDDTKRHVKNSVESKSYLDVTKPPMELKDIEKNPTRFSNGFVSFNLFIKNFATLKNRLGFFVNFRSYIQFHIHAIKTFLHIRMNKKGKELERKLNDAKIIPEEYLKCLETISFFTNYQKKDEDLKLFTSEFKKVNI